MRLLFITNSFPPASIGGYELWCHEVALGLRAQGHDVEVLTSRTAANDAQDWVHRELLPEVDFSSSANALLTSIFGGAARDRRNVQSFRRLSPQLDGVVVWGMWNIGNALAVAAEEAFPGRTVYYLGDYWPTLPTQYEAHWLSPTRSNTRRRIKTCISHLFLRLAKRSTFAQPRFEKSIVCSRFLRAELSRELPVFADAELIYGAVPTSRFASVERVAAPEPGILRLLWAGRLVPEKGAHTAVEAMSMLGAAGEHSFRLTIVGEGPNDNRARLQQLVDSHGLSESVTLAGRIEPSEMPRFFAEADVFLFTSIWPEPFGRVIVEAMASGALVVGASAGAAPEIIEHQRTGLLYEPGDAESLCTHLLEVMAHPDRRRQMIELARERAISRFDIDRMIAELESMLLRTMTGTNV